MTSPYRTVFQDVTSCVGFSVACGTSTVDVFQRFYLFRLLVVDVTKGIQTQTAECLVIGEITCGSMIVVLNKTDLLPEDKRQATISKVRVLYCTSSISLNASSEHLLGNSYVAFCCLIDVESKEWEF